MYEYFEFLGDPWGIPLDLFDACREAIYDRQLDEAAETSAMARAMRDQQKQIRRMEKRRR